MMKNINNKNLKIKKRPDKLTNTLNNNNKFNKNKLKKLNNNNFNKFNNNKRKKMPKEI